MDSTEELGSRLQRVVDDLEIRRAVTDYAAMVDARDWKGLEAVFAPDVQVDYHNGRTQVSGAESVVAYVRDNTAHLAWQHHFVSVYGVDVAGDEATTLAYLVSHQVIADEPTQVLTMAASYDVGLRRLEGQWVIARMTHTIRLANFLPITTSPPGGADVPPPVRH